MMSPAVTDASFSPSNLQRLPPINGQVTRHVFASAATMECKPIGFLTFYKLRKYSLEISGKVREFDSDCRVATLTLALSFSK